MSIPQQQRSVWRLVETPTIIEHPWFEVKQA
jgi:hypothetical protein